MVGEITHAVETNASPAFAWNYWTDVANWADPPAKFDHSESCGWFFMLTSASSRLMWTATLRKCRIFEPMESLTPLVSEAPLGSCRAWFCSKNAINDIPPDL